jgi:hypothetical protein
LLSAYFFIQKGGSWNFSSYRLIFYSSFGFSPIFVPIVFNFTKSHIGVVPLVAAEVLIIAS